MEAWDISHFQSGTHHKGNLFRGTHLKYVWKTFTNHESILFVTKA